MTYLTTRSWPVGALLISGGLLCGAWFFQHVLGYPPCQMCYWQRHAHKAVIGIAVAAIILSAFKVNLGRVMAALLLIAFLASFGLAAWHVGVEYGWWEGPKSCMSSAPEAISEFDPDEFFGSLEGPQKMPGCDEPLWHFLGLSMAAWNALVSLLGAVLSFLAIRSKDVIAKT